MRGEWVVVSRSLPPSRYAGRQAGLGMSVAAPTVSLARATQAWLCEPSPHHHLLTEHDYVMLLLRVWPWCRLWYEQSFTQDTFHPKINFDIENKNFVSRATAPQTVSATGTITFKADQTADCCATVPAASHH